MRVVCRLALAAALTLAAAPALRAQQAAAPAKDPQAAKPADQKPEQKPEEPPKYEETVVVSASRNEEKLIKAPATMTVIGTQKIPSDTTQDFSQQLRAL